MVRFPLPILIPPTSPHHHHHHHHHHLTYGVGIIGQIVADVPSGLSLTSLQEIITKQIKTKFRKEPVNEDYCLHSQCREILNVTTYDPCIPSDFPVCGIRCIR
jgi:hypothetical protein